MAPLDKSHTSFYWRFIVTMTLSCIISEIKRDIGRKSRFFMSHLHLMPPLGRNIVVKFGTEKLHRVSQKNDPFDYCAQLLEISTYLNEKFRQYS